MTTKKSEPVREAKPPKAAEVKKRTEKEPLMYVGPTVNGLGIQNRVYTRRYRKQRKRYWKKHQNCEICSSRSETTRERAECSVKGKVIFTVPS